MQTVCFFIILNNGVLGIVTHYSPVGWGEGGREGLIWLIIITVGRCQGERSSWSIWVGRHVNCEDNRHKQDQGTQH